MSFLIDIQELKKGLIIFRRSDVQHRNWYCRVSVPGGLNRYKTISLKTSDINQARELAFEHDADIRFRVRHDVPVFDRTFEHVAAEYIAQQKMLADTGQITMDWWKVRDGHVRIHLNPYCGNLQITAIGEDRFLGYPGWRQTSGTGRVKPGSRVSEATLRQEMKTLIGVMRFALSKGYIREHQVPKVRLPSGKGRREEFTPAEYRKLHRHARKWIDKPQNVLGRWTRTMVYNYMLVMTNTGMRTIEAYNLRWRDIALRSDRQGRPFVCFNVRGKSKYRELIAPHSVAEYLDRIRSISKSTKPDDFVFTSYDGTPNTSYYKEPIRSLLKEAGLLKGTTGTDRSAYSFRHTYATFRLMEGVDVYFLAKQMGTSVKMIEDYYGHITPSTSTDQILQGMPGWEPVDAAALPRPGGSPARKTRRARQRTAEPHKKEE